MSVKPPCIERLTAVVEDATPRPRALGDASAARPASGGWLPREIIEQNKEQRTKN